MRFSTPMSVFGVALALAVSLSAGAQDQPAAGSPPPDTSTQQQQPEASATPATQQGPAQTAAPSNDALPPPPIDMRRGPNPHRQANRLARELGLTSVQQSQIEPILADRIRRTRAVRTDATLGPRERGAEMREVSRDSVRRINAVLTMEQRQQWKQLRQEERAKRMEREQQLQSQPQPQPPVNNQQ